MKNRDWKEWAKRAGMRAVKTVAETAIATIGSAVVLGAVDWPMVLSASVLSGIVSLLINIKGLPELPEPEGE